jgi:hypothetical protein
MACRPLVSARSSGPLMILEAHVDFGSGFLRRVADCGRVTADSETIPLLKRAPRAQVAPVRYIAKRRSVYGS